MAKKQTRRSISVSRTTYERLKAFCESNNISMSQFVETRVGDFLGQGEGAPSGELTIRPTPPRPIQPAPAPVKPALPPKTETSAPRPVPPQPVPMTTAVACHAGGIADEVGLHGPATDCQRLEEAPRVRWDRIEPCREHFRKGRGVVRLRPVDARIACQLLEHERTAAGVGRHATPVVAGQHRIERKQRTDHGLRFVF